MGMIMIAVGVPYNFPNRCIYIIVMWFSMFVCSHPGPGEVDDVIDWCGRCWIAAVLEEEIGMGEKRHCYYL